MPLGPRSQLPRADAPAPAFSRRSGFDLTPNAIAERLQERARSAAPPLLDLGQGNPTLCGLGWDAQALRAALDVSGAERYEPTPQGLLGAREAIAAHCAARGFPARAESLFLTASTSESYAWLFKLLADPGDAVLVPRPSYPLLEYLAALECVQLEPYALRFDGEWWLDLASVRARLAAGGPRVRAVLVVNPGNPTGSFLSSEEAGALAELCAAHGAALVSDEVFSDYAHAPDALPAPGRRRLESLLQTESALTFCLGGFSKALALPQLKLGWIHVGGPAPLAAAARQRLELIADTWLPVGTPVQLAAARLLAQAPRVQARILERVRANLAALRARIGPDSPLSVLPVEGGWYAVLRVPRQRSDEAWVLHLLDRADVLVQPGYFFDFEQPGHLVVSLLPEPALFAEALARVLAVSVE